LTFDTGLAKLASYMFYDNKNNTGWLTNKMLLPPALLDRGSMYVIIVLETKLEPFMPAYI